LNFHDKFLSCFSEISCLRSNLFPAVDSFATYALAIPADVISFMLIHYTIPYMILTQQVCRDFKAQRSGGEHAIIASSSGNSLPMGCDSLRPQCRNMEQSNYQFPDGARMTGGTAIAILIIRKKRERVWFLSEEKYAIRPLRFDPSFQQRADSPNHW